MPRIKRNLTDSLIEAMQEITRKAAKAAGLKRYFTGEPCKRGHLSERLVSDRQCVACCNEKGRNLSGPRRERRRAAKHAWDRSPQGKALRKAHSHKPHVAMDMRDRARQRAARLAGYLPPPLEKDCPPRPANGCCQYCHKHVGTDKLRMDHNHNTGEFCAWCCPRCNRRITDNMGDFGELWPA